MFDGRGSRFDAARIVGVNTFGCHNVGTRSKEAVVARSLDEGKNGR